MTHRTQKAIKADLAAAKRDLRNLLRAAGDDLGCDGTGAEADALRGWISSYEAELFEARQARAARNAPQASYYNPLN